MLEIINIGSNSYAFRYTTMVGIQSSYCNGTCAIFWELQPKLANTFGLVFSQL